jgi:hypothetical protein
MTHLHLTVERRLEVCANGHTLDYLICIMHNECLDVLSTLTKSISYPCPLTFVLVSNAIVILVSTLANIGPCEKLA